MVHSTFLIGSTNFAKGFVNVGVLVDFVSISWLEGKRLAVEFVGFNCLKCQEKRDTWICNFCLEQFNTVGFYPKTVPTPKPFPLKFRAEESCKLPKESCMPTQKGTQSMLKLVLEIFRPFPGGT